MRRLVRGLRRDGAQRLDRSARRRPLAPRFVWLKVDLTDTEGDAELVAERLGVAGVPMTMVLDPDGTRVYAEPQFITAERMAKDLAAASARSVP